MEFNTETAKECIRQMREKFGLVDFWNTFDIDDLGVLWMWGGQSLPGEVTMSNLQAFVAEFFGWKKFTFEYTIRAKAVIYGKDSDDAFGYAKRLTPDYNPIPTITIYKDPFEKEAQNGN